MVQFHISTCRVCLVTCTDIVSLFEGAHSDRLREKLEFVTRTELSRHESLPRGVCVSCREALDAAHALATRCIAAETMFAQAIKSENDKSFYYDDVKAEERGDPSSPLQSCENENLDETRKLGAHLPCLYTDQLADDTNFDIKKGTIEAVTVKKDKKQRADITKGSKCDICGLVTRTPSALAIHMHKHTGERPYGCAHCSRTYSQKGSLSKHCAQRHNATRTPPAPVFTCEVCGKQFLRKSVAAVHLRIHTGEEPYACKLCPRRFKQIGPLIRHRRVHTGEKPFLCTQCPKRFTDKTALAAHMTVHSDERRFSCDACGKRFKTNNSLRKHVDRHKHGRRHMCDKCGESFTLKGNLAVHIRRQHSERAGVCQVCAKPVADVEEHTRRHTGRLFSCTLCSRRFLRAAGLRTHLRRHAHVDRHACRDRDCRMSFPTLATLHHHALKAHSQSMPHSCSHCARAFVRICDLTKHLKITHKILKIEKVRS